MAPCLAVGCIAAAQQTPVSQMETLTRGVVAVHTAEGNFVSWRLLGTDPEGTRFTLLRDGESIADGLAVTNYADSRGTDGSRYAVVADNEAGRADAAGGTPVWAEGFKRIQLDRPATTDGVGYMPHEAAVGDVDADGEYELVVKWLPTDWKDNATAGFSHTGITADDLCRLEGVELPHQLARSWGVVKVDNTDGHVGRLSVGHQRSEKHCDDYRKNNHAEQVHPVLAHYAALAARHAKKPSYKRVFNRHTTNHLIIKDIPGRRPSNLSTGRALTSTSLPALAYS